MDTPLANSSARYGMVAMLLHWGVAVGILVLVVMGWTMVALPDAGFDRTKISLILAHKSIGMIVGAVVVARIAWRNWTVLPQFVGTIPDWQKSAAYFVHLVFYTLMLALPLTGWLMSSAGGFPVYLAFDELRLPDLIGPDPRGFLFLIDLHRWLADALVAIIAVHTGAALAHHFVWRDDTLRKMLP